MQTADCIQKILIGMSQYDLSKKIGIKQSTISLLASGKTKPSASTCLALAGVCPPEDVDYWIEKSELSREALATISHALNIRAQPERLTGEERRIVEDFWNGASDAMGRSLRDAVRAWLSLHSQEQTGSTQKKSAGIVPDSKDFTESLDPRAHILLEAILCSGIPSFAAGIKANLESWGEVAIDKLRRLSGGSNQDAISLSPDIAKQIERARRLIEHGPGDEADVESGGKRSA